MKRTLLILICLLMGLPAMAKEQRPSTQHEVFFKGSDYELNVYRIRGRKNGHTILLIGGIQGDEPGGYMSADLYPDLTLEQGNLIIVPRANLKSIILRGRGADGDMNRQFHDAAKEGPMSQVVEKLKQLMGESDLFLHLHDGWGFHRPKYIDKLRNPSRYGQSIISDADNFECNSGEILDLRKMAQQVLKRTNEKISNRNYHLYYFNTHTADPKTSYPEMRQTATYYALRKHCLPSFGVEASKNLPTLELKILHHNLVINEFMALLDIIPETPKIFVPHPHLEYVELMHNGRKKTLRNEDSLAVKPGDTIKVTRVQANYDRGISCDLLGLGNLNDLGQTFKIKESTQLVFRKEENIFGQIHLIEGSEDSVQTKRPSRIFVLLINGKKRLYQPGDVVNIGKTDRLMLIGSFGDGDSHTALKLNLKGWVPDGRGGGNSGDDRGYEIIPQQEEFIQKYSRDNAGKLYPVVAVDKQGQQLGQIWIKLM